MAPYLEERIHRVRQLLDANEFDAVVATSTANFFYLSETWIDPHERLLAYVVPRSGDPVIFAPKMHEEDLADATVEVVFWNDGEDAMALLAKHLPERGTVSVDNLWPSQKLLSLGQQRPHLDFTDSEQTLSRLRLIKDEREITLLRESGAAADRVMEQVVSKITGGMSELEVNEELSSLWKKEGVAQLSFAPIVGSAQNGALPHHQSGDRVIGQGDMVVIDMGGILNHYCSDTTRTIAVGDVSAKEKEVYEVVRLAQQAGADAVKVGTPIGEVDRVTRRVIEEAGYGDYFVHRTGHGLGIEVHEAPFVVGDNAQVIEAGMVFSIEPGIYLQGQFGVRIEDIVVATENGFESFNQFTKKLLVV